MQQIKTWQLIDSSLKQNMPVVLLYVLESKGSSPGRQGFFMAVNANGDMEGSIGGGIMEHKFVETTRERLKVQGSRYKEVRKQIHDKTVGKNQSGMICSGEQTIWLYPVQEQDAIAIQQIIASLEATRNGTLQLSPAGIAFTDHSPENDFELSFQSEDDWLYKEKTGYKNHLYIIGGGHCSLALSMLMRSMDFYIRVYEDRRDLKTWLQNDYAHEKHLVNDYSELTSLIPAGPHHYVVIMTFGYRTDDIAVKALVGKDFRYIGLLGSRSKTSKMMEQYRESGIDQEWLQRIHAPVGLQIKSQTPEEIAVSIAGQIIEEKNKHAN